MASPYYDKTGKEVYDNDIAYADDLNTINDAVDTGFQLVDSAIGAVQSDAEFYANKAEKWAEEAEDVEVEPGKYSSLHHAAKAEEDSTLTAADKVQTGLDATATAADRVQTGLDATATAADRVQTGLDVTASSNSAAEALVSENKAEKWADEDEDVEVEVGKYSAKHWAAKAAEGSTDTVLSVTGTGVDNTDDRNPVITITPTVIGLGNVDNTSDADKPISTAQDAGLVSQTSETGAAEIPAGTTAERDVSPRDGDFRFNTDLGDWEGYDGTEWRVVDDSILTPKTNLLINGGFQIWQRGTSFSSVGYTADRWYNSTVNTTVTKNGAEFRARMTTNNTSSPEIRYPLPVTIPTDSEEPRPLTVGNVYTLSFFFNPSVTCRPRIDLAWGDGSAAGNETVIKTVYGVTQTAGGGAIQEITFTLDVSPATTNNCLNIDILTDGGTWSNGQYFQLSEVKLEESSVATPFEWPNRKGELARCCQYYNKSYAYDTDLGTATNTGQFNLRQDNTTARASIISMFAAFPTIMRDYPTITVYSPTTGASGYCRSTIPAKDIVVSSAGRSDIGIASLNLAEAASDGSTVSFHYTADAEI